MKKAIVMLLMSGLLLSSCGKKEDINNTPAEQEKAQDTAGKEAPAPAAENAPAPAAAADNKDLAQGFKDYKKASITSEAKMNLKGLSMGAISYFESEHYEDDSCSVIVSKVFPKSETAIQIGPEVGESTIGQNYTAPDMPDGAWKKLLFMPSMKSYYTYYYISDGKKFVAKASASIEKACDSIWMVTGEVKDNQAVVSGVQDVTGKEDCNGVKL